MIARNWQPKVPFSTVIFDCDGTLSTIEGIDTLAEHNGVGREVSELTADAMSRMGMNLHLYQRRLDLVNPTQEQIVTLSYEYYSNRVDDIQDVIQVFQRLKKKVCILSAGIYPAVRQFGELLHIATENVHAVDIQFDANGCYLDFDRHSPLVNSHGKRVVVDEIKKNNKDILYIGDGLNDIEVLDMVDRFVGYGGVFYRENIENQCEYYLRSLSMSALLPLGLTQDEVKLLLPEEMKIYNKGKELLVLLSFPLSCTSIR